MRFSYLFISLLLFGGLTACGSEDPLTPPVFSNVMVESSTDLTIRYKDPSVDITGTISDYSATIVANNISLTAEEPVDVNPSDGSWSYPFKLLAEGANTITLTATDPRGNINQLILTVTHDTTAPTVSTVTQSQDGTPAVPKLVVTFSEEILVGSLKADGFVVLKDGLPLLTLSAEPPLTPTTTTTSMVTLPLAAALPAGSYTLTCTGVTDLATLNGNSIADGSPFPFAIQ